MAVTSLSSDKNTQRGVGCLVMFFGIFFAAGLLFFVIMLGLFLEEVQANNNFAEGSCIITDKTMLTSSDSDGTSYRPYFEFRLFTQDGREIRTSGYRVTEIYYGDRSSQQAILDNFAVGDEYPCWYNPANPEEAMLRKGGVEVLDVVILIVPTIFMAVGIIGIVTALISARKTTKAKTEISVANPSLAGSSTTPTAEIDIDDLLPSITKGSGKYLSYRLTPESSHTSNFLVFGAFSLFWNGMIAIFLVLFIQDEGLISWVTLFFVPFVLVGLFMIYMTFRNLMVKLTAGKTVVEIEEEPLQPGQQTNLFVTQTGGNKNIDEIQVTLILQESATYTRGTDRHTETHTAFSQTLYQTGALQIGSGGWQQNIDLNIPANAIHSFKTRNNALKWKITVAVKAANAPDFELEFPFRVTPPPVNG